MAKGSTALLPKGERCGQPIETPCPVGNEPLDNSAY
jgi:hypothetical protein